MRLHVGVGVLEVDGGQVDRGLLAHLQEQRPLLLGLVRLVGPPTQPAHQAAECQHHHQAERRRQPTWDSVRFGLATDVVLVERLLPRRRASPSTSIQVALLPAIPLSPSGELSGEFSVASVSSPSGAAASSAMFALLQHAPPDWPGCRPGRLVQRTCRNWGRIQRLLSVEVPDPAQVPLAQVPTPGPSVRNALTGQRGVRVAFPVEPVVQRYVDSGCSRTSSPSGHVCRAPSRTAGCAHRGR